MGRLCDPQIAEFALRLRDRLSIKTLVETGTFRGESTRWGALNFETVDTIDVNEGYIHEAMDKCDGLENVIFRLGDSRKVLTRVVEQLEGPALFWLDAHQANGLFAPVPDDCPVLEELMAVLCSRHPHAVLIDDAHCFIPPQPYDPKAYPEIWRIKAMAREAGRICGVNHDVIAILPPDLDAELAEFAGSNPAHMHGFIPGGRRRFSVNLMRRQPFAVRATVAVGDNVPPAPEPSNDEDARAISEVVNTRYGKMIVPVWDTNQTPPLRSGGIAQQWREIDELIAVVQSRQPGAVFVDVGANVGTFAFALRPHCAEVYAFEPQRILFNMLAGSVALNGWLNVYCVHAAVGESSGAIEVPQFDYSQRCSFGSIEFGGEQKERLSQEPRRDQTEYVSLVPLDAWTFKRVDVLKIDVEGMEMDVLAGARNMIDRFRPTILIEHGKVGMDSLHNWMRAFGYRCRDLGADILAEAA